MAAELGFDYKECFERKPLLKESDIADLKKWITSQDADPNIPKDVSDKQLVLFHCASNYIMEDTKKCIRTYFSVREKAPEVFDDRDCELPQLIECAKVVEHFAVPHLTDQGQVILFHRLHDFDPNRYDYLTSNKLFYMTVDCVLHEKGPVNGAVLLCDMRGSKLAHLFKPTLSYISKMMRYVQDGMPLRIAQIHILNCGALFDKILTLLKPFMHKEVAALFHLHPPNMDMEQFYQECLPKKCLPSDFGGDLPDTQTMNKQNFELIKSYKSYFNAEQKHRHTYIKKSKKAKEHSFAEID